MRKVFGGYPPRYAALLRLALAAALLRLIPFVPFVLAYAFLPPGSWLRLILLLCPVLWLYFVLPARARYGAVVAAYVKDQSAPPRTRDLLQRDPAWRAVCRGRVKMMRLWALPLFAMLLFLLLLFLFVNVFAAVKALLDVFGGIATVLSAMAAFLPRLFMGEPMAQQAGALGAVAVLAIVLAVCLGLFGWGAFRSSAYRFGYTAGMPKKSGLTPLLKSNLLLWLPTLILLSAFGILSSQELGLMFSNFLGAAPLFTVKLQIPQIILASLAAVSYIILLPIRKLNTAIWAQNQLESEDSNELGMRNEE